MLARRVVGVVTAACAVMLAGCGGSPTKLTVSTTTAPASTTTAPASTTTAPASTTTAPASTTTASASTTTGGRQGNGVGILSTVAVTEADGFVFHVRAAGAPSLSAQQGGGSDPNYPSAPPGEDWLLAPILVHSGQSDRSTPLADFIAPLGSGAALLGVAFPLSDRPDIKGQCLLPGQIAGVSPPAGYCYTDVAGTVLGASADLEFSDGSFYNPALGGAPTLPPGGNAILNFYAGPVTAGLSISGVKLWVTNGTSRVILIALGS